MSWGPTILLAVVILCLIRVVRDLRRGGRMTWDRTILVTLASLYLIGLMGFYVGGDWGGSSSGGVQVVTTSTP